MEKPAMRLIVTRPAEDIEALSGALADLGCEPVAAPVMRIVFRDGVDLPHARYATVAVTSANGARALARHPGRRAVAGARAYTVGPASTAAARAAGFTDVVQAGGDVEALIAEIRRTADPAAGPVLYPSGAQTTGDLERQLGAVGFEVDRAVLYEARAADALPHEALDAIAADGTCAVVLYSPRTARLWATLAESHGIVEAARKMTHFCLSRNVARALAEAFGSEVPAHVAERPDEAAMLDLIARHIGPH